MTPDERRAKEIARLHMARLVRGISANVAWEQYSINGRADALMIARAIRADDDAAGMVLVPREQIQRVITAIEDAAPDVLTDTLWLLDVPAETAVDGLRAMLAATEAPDAP